MSELGDTMKINVNYELISKIGEAKIGINVHRVGKKMAFLNGVMTAVSFMITPNDPKQIAAHILYSFSLISFQSLGLELAGSRRQKEEANESLKELSCKLNDINVSTNSSLLMEAESYKTKYKINFNDGIIPKVIQNKYIMVPTRNEGEVSLLQEHIIGTRDYDLSVGEPMKAKQYRLAFNGA